MAESSKYLIRIEESVPVQSLYFFFLYCYKHCQWKGEYPFQRLQLLFYTIISLSPTFDSFSDLQTVFFTAICDTSSSSNQFNVFSHITAILDKRKFTIKFNINKKKKHPENTDTPTSVTFDM